MASSSEEELEEGLVVYTADEVLEFGLKQVHFTKEKISKSNRDRNIHRFKVHFGSSPLVCARIFTDLQTTELQNAHVPVGSRNIKHFLMAMHHLKVYPTEVEREAIFDVSPSYGRDWCWYYVLKISALKESKIKWPSDSDDIWVLSVDGVDCWVQEPQHPTWSQDRKYYSHKFNKAGLTYELGMSLHKSQLVWMNGPYRAGMSDRKIFREKGLKAKLEETGKRAIADGGYTGYPKLLSTPNNGHDSVETRRFKSRALKRHEKFNGYIKNFRCLNSRFRHSLDRFKYCFEAICVICQYQMDEGSLHLFDILLEDMAY